MNKAKRIFLTTFLGFSLGALLCGCNEEDGIGKDARNVAVQMSIGSRAVDGEDPGTDDERQVNSLRVYAYAGKEQIGYYKVETPDFSSGSHRFTMDLAVVTTGAEQKVDFYLVANEAAMKGMNTLLKEKMTVEELKALRFLELNLPNLPMTAEYLAQSVAVGTSTPSTEPGHEGHLSTGTEFNFELERPVGRIGVYFARETSNTQPLSVREIDVQANGRRAHNYLFLPAEEKLKTDEWSEIPMSIFSGNKTIETNIAEGSTDPKDYTEILNTPYYLFENCYGSGNADAGEESGYDAAGKYRGNVITIAYTLDGEQKEKEVYLPKIERNKFYKVFCLVRASGGIEITYAVADWDDDETILDVDYPTYNCDPERTNPDGTKDYSTNVWYDDVQPENGAFKVKFTYSQPIGVTWQPTVRGGYYEVHVYDYNTKQEITDKMQWVGRAQPYLICVIPLHQYDPANPNTGVLQISTRTWAGDNDLLLINRDNKWGDVRTDIPIKQVAPEISGN